MVPTMIVWYTNLMQNIYQNKTIRLIIFLSAVLYLPAESVYAQKTAPPAIDPKAQECLKQCVAAYEALHSYSCQAETELKVDSLPGSRIIKFTLNFQRPNQAAVSVSKYGETQQFFTEGKKIYSYLPDKKQYFQDALPPDIPATAPVLTQGETFIGLTLLKPNGLLTNSGNIQSMTLGPVEVLDGGTVQTVTKVMNVSNGGKMTFFVTIGIKDHLVHRFASTIQSSVPLPIGGGNTKRIDDREIYTDIKVDQVLPAATFLPPADAKKAEPDQQNQK